MTQRTRWLGLILLAPLIWSVGLWLWWGVLLCAVPSWRQSPPSEPYRTAGEMDLGPLLPTDPVRLEAPPARRVTLLQDGSTTLTTPSTLSRQDGSTTRSTPEGRSDTTVPLGWFRTFFRPVTAPPPP